MFIHLFKLLLDFQANANNDCLEQQFCDLKEQYVRLSDDYKSKLCEVSCLRTDLNKLKCDICDTREERDKLICKLHDIQEKLKVIEAEKAGLAGTNCWKFSFDNIALLKLISCEISVNREQQIETQQALNVARKRFQDAQDEIEEMQAKIQDQGTQLSDYRHKYLTVSAGTLLFIARFWQYVRV